MLKTETTHKNLVFRQTTSENLVKKTAKNYSVSENQDMIEWKKKGIIKYK